MKRKIVKPELAVSTPEMDALNAVSATTWDNLAGKTVIIRKSAFSPTYQAGDRRFHATGGFGCNPNSLGHAVFGFYLSDGESAREESYNVVGIAVNQATDVDIIRAKEKDLASTY